MSTVPLPPDYYEHGGPPLRPRRNWKRISAWIIGGLVVLTAVLLIGVVALLQNQSFRLYLLRIVETRLSETAGIQLKMRDYSVHLSGLSPAVDMYDVVIDGAPPYQTPPLVQADHLSISVQIVSLLQRKWYLKDVVINHPVARVIVAENGDTNLPKSSGEQTDLFDLGVRHVMVSEGELYYNDKKSALDADVHNLEFQSSFDPVKKQYGGGLRYTDGKVHFQNLNPMVHNFEAEFEANPDTFTLKRSVLTSGASQFSLAATLNDYAHPKVTATYQSSLDTGELRQVLKDATLPVGVVKLVGSAKFESDPNKAVIDTLELEGNLSSTGLQIHTTTIHTLVRDVGARYVLRRGNLDLPELRAGLLGGRMNGNFKMRDVTGTQVSELHAALDRVALAGIQALVNPQAMKDFRIDGTANAKIDAKWRKTFDTMTARVDADAAGALSGRTASLQQLQADIHANYSAGAQTVSFTHSSIQTPQTTVNLDGTVSRTASLQVQVRSADLSEIETIANAFVAAPEAVGLGGMATLNATVRGSITDPEIQGQLTATSLTVKGTEWRTVRTGIDASSSHIALTNGDLTPGNNRGRITFNVNVGLDQWAFRETSPLQVDVNASQWDVTDIQNLAGVQAPVTGTLSANISLRGSQLSPVGKGTVTLTNAEVANEPIQSATLDAQATGDEIRARLRSQIGGGTVQTNLVFRPKEKSYDGDLQIAGLRLDQLRNLRSRNLNITGTVTATAKGSGTFDDPNLQLTAQIPQLQVRNQTISAIKLEGNLTDHVATFALDSQSQTLGTYVRGRGHINLTGNYDSDVALDTSAISLQPLIALSLPERSADLTGQTEIHAVVKGPLKDTTRLEAQLTIPTLSLSYKNSVQLAAAEPIQLEFRQNVVTLKKTSIHGTATDLQVEGTIPVDSSAPMKLTAIGKVDLGVFQLYDPDITSSGQLEFNIGGGGQQSNPNFQGQVRIVNAAFAGDSLPVGLQNGNGVLAVTSTRVEIERFEGRISGGRLTATGGLTYRPSVQFNLAVAANDIRTLYPQGVREAVDTNLTVAGSLESAVIRGEVRLTELSFSPTFDLNDIASVAGSAPGATAPPGSFARNLNLDIHIVSTSDLNLASSKLSLQGTTDLRVRGNAAAPAIIGRVNLTGGDLIYRGNRYVLEPSTIDFVDPYRIEPRMNLGVSTKVQDYDIRMLFRGTVDQIRTTFTSEPPLPPSDIINLLVFGKTTDVGSGTTPGNLGPTSMIASQVSQKVTGGIENVAGISQFSIDPVLGGSQDPGARITIQQRVTGNMFVTFATDASSTQRQVIKVEYQATPRVGVSAVRDQNGGFAFDVRMKKTW